MYQETKNSPTRGCFADPPFLNVYPQERVREAPRYAGRSPDDRVTVPVARDICQREAIKAILSGAISSMGSNYVLSLEALNCRTGDTIARQQAEAATKERDREGFVKRILPQQPRVRLDPELYERLRQQVLRRDGWNCQDCGTRSNLEVHHKELRSQGGDDSEENLITRCTGCHSRVHRCST